MQQDTGAVMMPLVLGNARLGSPMVSRLLAGDGNATQRPWWPPAHNRPMRSKAERPSPRASSYSPLAFGQDSAQSTGDDEDGGEDDLTDLLNIALSTSFSGGQSECNNETSPADLAKADTSESATLSSLIATLHDASNAGRQPHLGLQHLLSINSINRDITGGLEGQVFNGPVATLDFDIDDAPLVSRRFACHTPDNDVVHHIEASSLASVTPVPPASRIKFSIPEQKQQSPFSGGADDSPYSLRFGVGFGGGGVGSVGVPQQLAQACVLYVAVFLTQESRDVLLAMVPPAHPLVSADHMTLAYKPSVQQLLDLPLGAHVQLKIIGSAADSRAQAVAADPPTWLPPTTSVSTHITISVAVGAKAVEAGHLIMDALQRAAACDPAGPSPSGAGAYTHFDEALPLVGTLGVRLALSDGERTVCSIEELAAGGWLSIGSEDVAAFHKRHAAVLGSQPLQRQPSPTSMLDLPMISTSSSSAGSYSPLTSVVMPPLQLPPSLLAPLDGANSWVDAAPAEAAASSTQNAEQPPGWSQLTACDAAAGAETAELLNNEAGLLDDDTASTGTGSSGSDAVQFKSSVQIGDYVALRPFVPTAAGEKTVQGYVTEFACNDAFQGNGVMVLLNDSTIGFVAAVLDRASGSKGKQTQPSNSKGRSRAGKRSRGRSKGAAAAKGQNRSPSAGKLSALDAAASDAADALSEWALATRDTAAATAGLSRRNAEDAQRDLQLWNEFDALQQHHGEALCCAILQDCNQDFVEAIATIKAQFAGFAGDSSTAAAAAAPAAATQVEQPVGQRAVAAVAAAPAGAEAVGHDEDLVQQLALSLGLSAGSAIQLCKLVPHIPAERAVEVLQQQGGDVNKAADVLLSADAPATAGAAGRPTQDSTPVMSPADRVAAAMVNSKDATLVVNARSLCAMYPGMQQEMAEMLLQEHGSLEEAAHAVSDMQAKELEARTAAAGMPLPSHLLNHAPAATEQQPQEQQHHPSEADQLAMLAAMGLLSIIETEHTLTTPSPPPRQRTPPCSSTPPKSPPMPPAHARYTYYSGAQAGPSSNRAATTRQQQLGVYDSPPSQGVLPMQHQHHQQQRHLPDYSDQEAKRAAKEAADRLYAKSKTLQTAATVYMTAAQALLADNDMQGYKDKKAAADKVRAESKAAFEEAQRLSWSANNKAQQTWQADLHGLAVHVALRKFVSQFEMLAAMDCPGGVLYKVIVGKGKHSEDNVPKIKLGVLQYLEEKAEQVLGETGEPWPVQWQIDPCNEGLLCVYIPGGCRRDGAGAGDVE